MGPFDNRIQSFNPVGDLNFNFKYKEKADKSSVILLSASYFRMFDKEPVIYQYQSHIFANNARRFRLMNAWRSHTHHRSASGVI